MNTSGNCQAGLWRSESNLSAFCHRSSNKNKVLLGSIGKEECPFQSTLRSAHYLQEHVS